MFAQKVKLQVEQLACVRQEQLLWKAINFEVHSGQLLQITGDNGCGKTSLLRVLTGVIRPYRGTVYWHGQPIAKQWSTYRSQIQYLGHRLAVKDELTVSEHLNLSTTWSRLAVLNSDYQALWVELNLSALAHCLCRTLSQGQRQRVAIAALILSAAPLWILDEPLAALDLATMHIIQQCFLQHLLQGGAIIITTHHPLAGFLQPTWHVQL